jgi:hypothetical protein
VSECATKTKEAISLDKQRKARGAAGHQGVVNYAFAALRLLADKLYAVTQMNLLFVKTQVGGWGATGGCRQATLHGHDACNHSVGWHGGGR